MANHLLQKRISLAIVILSLTFIVLNLCFCFFGEWLNTLFKLCETDAAVDALPCHLQYDMIAIPVAFVIAVISIIFFLNAFLLHRISTERR